MKKTNNHNNIFNKESNQLAFNLGYDYYTEHERGIEGLHIKLGVIRNFVKETKIFNFVLFQKEYDKPFNDLSKYYITDYDNLHVGILKKAGNRTIYYLTTKLELAQHTNYLKNNLRYLSNSYFFVEYDGDNLLIATHDKEWYNNFLEAHKERDLYILKTKEGLCLANKNFAQFIVDNDFSTYKRYWMSV